MSEPLTLTFKNEERSLELQFTPSGERTFDAVARIRQRNLELTYSFGCFGYDLEEFARTVIAFHSRYDGVARFDIQSGDIELELSLANPGRGIVAVVATLNQWIAWPADYAAVKSQAERRSLIFNGFTIEQSYLPHLVAQIRTFLADSGVSIVHPMIQDRTAQKNG